FFGCIVRCKTEAEFEIKGSRTERGKGWTTNVLGAEKPDGKGSILCRVLDPRICGQHPRANGKTAPPCCCNRGRRTAMHRDRSILHRFPCRADRRLRTQLRCLRPAQRPGQTRRRALCRPASDGKLLDHGNGPCPPSAREHRLGS